MNAIIDLKFCDSDSYNMYIPSAVSIMPDTDNPMTSPIASKSHGVTWGVLTVHMLVNCPENPGMATSLGVTTVLPASGTHTCRMELYQYVAMVPEFDCWLKSLLLGCRLGGTTATVTPIFFCGGSPSGNCTISTGPASTAPTGTG